MSEKTIAAVSTPAGQGGIGIIRISGDDAAAVADRCFKSVSGRKLRDMKGYTAALGTVTDRDGTDIEEAVALVFRAPKSYTGENTVELSVHGGSAVTRRVLRRVFECGASPAQGGEFTKRAFLNGKMDLTRAESVMGIISARGDAALRIARAAADGKIAAKVKQITDRLLETAANIAVFADYPDEDIPQLEDSALSQLLEGCAEELKSLISTYDAGRAVREGIDCVIAGKPNVGKSTLMNMLCGDERSIVTDIAGTTRDVVEAAVYCGDIQLNLADTAGIHETADTVEKFGIDRALSRIDTGGIILAVFDASSPLDRDDLRLLDEIRGRRAIAVLNKCDLGVNIDRKRLEDLPSVEICAKSGGGYNLLSDAIAKLCRTAELSENDTVLISERQLDCARRAYSAVCEARSALLSGITLDAVGVCVDSAVSALLELTGKRVTDEVTDEVFKRFCVGK